MAGVEPTLSQIYYVVLPLLLRAGQILAARQRELAGVPIKARHERGQAVEAEIRTFLTETLLQLFPKHGVYEPGSLAAPESPAWQWVVTPLDGGRYYFRGLPLYTTSLALRREGEIVLGIVLEPATQSIFRALKGEGAFLNEQALHVSDERSLTNACCYLESAAAPDERDLALRARLAAQGCRVHDLGVSTLGLSYVAVGAFDAFLGRRVEGSLPALAAGLLIAKEAGATLSDGDGKPLRPASSSNVILVATPILSRSILGVLWEQAAARSR
jgi:myo-inositol-1(or 4)-monophosphatase